MSAFGPKRTSLVAPHMSAFGGKAHVTRTLICKDPAERICVQLSVELTASVAGGPGCSTETGSDAGKVFFRASSSAFSRRQYSRLPRLFTS